MRTGLNVTIRQRTSTATGCGEYSVLRVQSSVEAAENI